MRFVVVHLLGSHSAYDLWFPAEFGNFKTETNLDKRVLERRGLMDYLYRGSRVELNNAYDDTILYDDSAVYGIIKLVRELTRDYSIFYVSDHGEALGETGRYVGHMDAEAPKQVYQVARFFVLSHGVEAALGGVAMKSLRANLHKRFETNGLIHSMLSLYDVPHDQWMSHKSLFSSDY